MPAVVAGLAWVGTWAGASAGMAAVVGGAIVGAVAGGVIAAVKGENIIKGALIGGLIGATLGGIGTAAAPSAVEAGAAAQTTGMGVTGAIEAGYAGTSAETVMAAAGTGPGLTTTGGLVATAPTAAVTAAPTVASAGGMSIGEAMVVQSVMQGGAAMMGEDQSDLQQQAFENNRKKYQEGVSIAPTEKVNIAPSQIAKPTPVAAPSLNAPSLSPGQQPPSTPGASTSQPPGQPQIAGVQPQPRRGLLEGEFNG